MLKYICLSCGKEWDYPIEKCIFCNKNVYKLENNQYEIDDSVKVYVPSLDHPIAPYCILLLRDSVGSFRFHKTFDPINIDNYINIKDDHFSRSTIGIIGTGITGAGIADIALRSGFEVIIKSRTKENLDKIRKAIGISLSKSLQLKERDDILENLITTINYESFENADIIIESVIENLLVKKDIFRILGKICSDHAILASNTSSLSISQLAKGIDRPERVVGLHFFNPIQRMQLVEVITTDLTSESIYNKCVGFVNRLGKTPIKAKDTPGFVVNRLLFIMINEACHILENGVSRMEDIDKAMKLGANHVMGPFELADLIGLDLSLEIIENLEDSLGNKFEASNLLRDYVSKGYLGRKTKKGFYTYK